LAIKPNFVVRALAQMDGLGGKDHYKAGFSTETTKERKNISNMKIS